MTGHTIVVCFSPVCVGVLVHAFRNEITQRRLGIGIFFVFAVHQNQANIRRAAPCCSHQAQAGEHAICEAQAQAYSIALAVREVHHNILLFGC